MCKATANSQCLQVRGKKNLVLEQSLAGPIGILVKFSTLQDYGADKVFFLENGNADTSQRNVVFITRGESARNAQSIAGMYVLEQSLQARSVVQNTTSMGSKSRLRRPLLPLYLVSPDPDMNNFYTLDNTVLLHLFHL
jgi:hypothetical protein